MHPPSRVDVQTDQRDWFARLWPLTSSVLLPFFLTFALALAITAYIETHAGISAVAPTENPTLSPLAQLMNLSPLANSAAPPISLTDQRGHRVRLEDFRGKVVVLAFIDSRCTEVCPIIAQELIGANHDLGKQMARNVVFVGVNVNPRAESTVDVARFTNAHGLGTLPNWYFLTGSTKTLARVWKAYGIQVELPANASQTVHADYLYFLNPLGRERFLAAPYANQRRNGTGFLSKDIVAQWSQGIALYIGKSFSTN
jgi:cytochrome oxidase Cu insertion factor (SCO1/SenC/PrrC family)